MKKKPAEQPFHSSREEVRKLIKEGKRDLPLYELAFLDKDFLLREELRPVRLQLELLKPELVQQDEGVEATIVFFGSARIPSAEDSEVKLAAARAALAVNPRDVACQKSMRVAESLDGLVTYYEEARRLAKLVNEQKQRLSGCPKLFVSTGGGPGIMEAANRGAHEAGEKSLGLGIVIPNEQLPNPYVSPELTFLFHYFAIRKMHFLIRAKAMIAFPGGYGTLDEIFDALTLMQTGKMNRIPLIMFGRDYWNDIIDFKGLVKHATIDEEDFELVHFVETAEEAWQIIVDFYGWGKL